MTPVTPILDDQAAALRRLVEAQRATRPEALSVATPAARAPASPRDAQRSLPGADAGRAARGPVVTVASGKGGVGKSTVAINVACAIANASTDPRRVTLVDADLGTANADVLCGLAPTRRLDAEIFRSQGPDFSRLVVPTAFGFGLVPGAAGVAHAPRLDREQRGRVIDAVRALPEPGDLALVDLGAGIGAMVVEAVAAADLAIVVTTPDPTALADAYALIKCVVRHRRDPRPLRMGIVVNQADSRALGHAAHARIDRVCRRFLGGEVPLLGIVRDDRRAAASVRARTPLLATGWGGAAARDLRRLGGLIGAVAPRVGRDVESEHRSCS